MNRFAILGLVLVSVISFVAIIVGIQGSSKKTEDCHVKGGIVIRDRGVFQACLDEKYVIKIK